MSQTTGRLVGNGIAALLALVLLSYMVMLVRAKQEWGGASPDAQVLGTVADVAQRATEGALITAMHGKGDSVQEVVLRLGNNIHETARISGEPNLETQKVAERRQIALNETLFQTR